MFLGEFEVRLDPQGRIAIPAKFREELSGGFVLARGIDGCITAYPVEEWNKVYKRVSSLPSNLRKARRMRRITFSGAFNAEMDRQGRVLLPQRLRQAAGIDKEEVLISGAGDYFEIWSKARWEREGAPSDEDWQIAESLEERNE